MKNNHFHPLNFFVPCDIKQMKPSQVMMDGTVVSFYTFRSEARDDQQFLLKISTSEQRQYNENLIYKFDNRPDCMLGKLFYYLNHPIESKNAFSFKEKSGKTFYYTVFEMTDLTLDELWWNEDDFNGMI